MPFSVPFYSIEYHIGAEPPQEGDCVQERTAPGGVRDSNTEMVHVSRDSSAVPKGPKLLSNSLGDGILLHCGISILFSMLF